MAAGPTKSLEWDLQDRCKMSSIGTQWRQWPFCLERRQHDITWHSTDICYISSDMDMTLAQCADRTNFCLKLTVIKFLIRIRARPEEFWRYHKVWLLDEPSPQSSVSQRQEGADHWQILLLIDWLLHGLKYKRLWMLWLHHKICDIVKINVFISTRTKRHKLQRPEMTLYSKCTTYPIPSQLFSGS